MPLNEHFFVGIPGPVLGRQTQKMLRDIRPGGIILFARNVQSPRQLSGLTTHLRKILGPDLLICLDHEGGRVNRLKDLVGVVPSALQLGWLGNPRLAKKHGELTGRLLFSLGVNVNLAPVLDLLLKPKTDNSVPDRCWARDPAQVIRMAGAFLEGMQKQGVIGCGKHFLGYGAADKDPHLLLPRVNRTRQQILKEDLIPYQKLLPSSLPLKKRDAGLRMIMLSHAHLRAFHGKKLTPACISPIVNGTLLRDEMGFRGVTITDDLEMGAITRTMDVGDAVVRCLELGTDLILICHTEEAIRKGYRAAQKRWGFEPERHPPLALSHLRLRQMRQSLKPQQKFSPSSFARLCREIHQFTLQVFRQLPPKLRVIDARWGAIGEKY